VAKAHKQQERNIFKAMGWRRTWKELWDGEGEDCEGTTWYGELKTERMKPGFRALSTLLERAWAQVCNALEQAANDARNGDRVGTPERFLDAPRVVIYSPTGTSPRYSLAYVGDGRLWFLKEFVEQVLGTDWKGDTSSRR